MMKTELIFLPAPAPGHLVSTVEFSKRLIARDARLSVTVLLMNSAIFRGPQTDPTPGIPLPLLDPPPPELIKGCVEHAISLYVASYAAHVKDAIARFTRDQNLRIAGLFLDMFCTSIIDVASQLSLPSYIFFTSSAAFLGYILHLPDRSADTPFHESGPEAVIPCFQNPVLTRAMPTFAFSSIGYKSFMGHAKRFKETKGILVNTFAELEPYALSALSLAYPTVPVHTVGPVLDLASKIHKPGDAAERAQIMRWLNKQPESSVVFLCFGSRGHFSETQIREISRGLAQSGQKFLWSIRKPPVKGSVKTTEYTGTELRGILEEEFWSLLEKAQQGIVCRWAPQVEILAHKSTGAFVSHCGWNSILESMWFGKPIVTWPLYAEQQINAFQLVRELGMAVELRLDYRISRSDLVEAGEVERAVRDGLDKNNPVRLKVEEMKEACRKNLMEGGVSFGCVDTLIREFVGDEEMVVERFE